MKSDQTLVTRRAQAKAIINGKRTTPQQQGNVLWSFVNTVVHSVGELYTRYYSAFAKSLEAYGGAMKWLIPIQYRAIYSLAVWVVNDVERKLNAMIMRAVDALKAWTFAQLKAVYYIMAVAVATLRTQLTARIHAEEIARIKAIARAEAQAKTEVRALHQAIEREAATSYKSANAGHLNAISVLSDAISAMAPALKSLISRVVGYAIDLAEIDNPIIAFLAGKLLSFIIDRLGIDAIAGHLLHSLVLPASHIGAPSGLPEVITLICGRINALENFNAQFMADGGPEILQAGEEWRNTVAPLTSVALAAFFTTMVAAPDEWATVISDTIGIAVSDTISAVTTLLGG